jgi:hypothetical protein
MQPWGGVSILLLFQFPETKSAHLKFSPLSDNNPWRSTCLHLSDGQYEYAAAAAACDFAVSQGHLLFGTAGYEVSLAHFALGYNPLEWPPAPAAGLYLPTTSASVLHAGAPFPFSTPRLWSRIEMLLRLNYLPEVRTRRKVEDSRPAPFSSSGIGSSPCWGAVAWARFTAPRILNLGML